MKIIEDVSIIQNKEIARGIYDMRFISEALAKSARVGQFIEIYIEKGENLLPRPISICEIDTEKNMIRIVYQVVGKGTDYMKSLTSEHKMKVMGPIGNGFSLTNKKSIAIVGGGIGSPPLLELAKEIRKQGDCYNINVFLGFRTGELKILQDDFKKHANHVFVATDDGSYGYHGNVIDLMKKENIQADMIYTCGPKIMLKAVTQYAKEIGAKSQVSMEERMACGLGACVGCAIKIMTNEGSVYKKVCVDGPVFNAEEVAWDE